MKEIAPFDLGEKGTIKAENGKTALEGIFAGGDIVHGGKTVVEAVAAGKMAAAEMINYLEKKEVK